MAAFSCSLAARESPSTCCLTVHAPKSWPTESQRAPQRDQHAYSSHSEDWSQLPPLLPLLASRAQPTGLKAWPLGSSPSSTRLAPAGAPGLRGLRQQRFSCQEAGIICALRCLEPRKGAHGRSLCVRTGQGCGRGKKGGGRQQCLFCFVLASAIRTVKQPWVHHQ